METLLPPTVITCFNQFFNFHIKMNQEISAHVVCVINNVTNINVHKVSFVF